MTTVFIEQPLALPRSAKKKDLTGTTRWDSFIVTDPPVLSPHLFFKPFLANPIFRFIAITSKSFMHLKKLSLECMKGAEEK